MRACLAALAATLAAASAWAAPSLEIRGVAARVVIVPEHRTDISVRVLSARPDLPLRIEHLGDRVVITAARTLRIRGCYIQDGKRGVRVRGRADIPYENLPQLIILAPSRLKMTTGAAVFGAIGRSASLDLENRGCGDWTIANVAGAARVRQDGAALVQMGESAGADVNVSGGGDVAARRVAGSLVVVSAGAGRVRVEEVEGHANLRVAGSGDVQVRTGRISDLFASVAGSGRIGFDGQAGNVNASVTGSGQVIVAKASGKVTRRTMGKGEVRVGG
jgi:Putative auto-transporter adhesin, head GIN domain